MSALGIERHV